MSDESKFNAEVQKNVANLGADDELKKLSLDWMIRAGGTHKYSYNFSWLGRPIIQYPQDMVAIQELVWRVRPDLIIETGIAHGGSLLLTASLLATLDYCDAADANTALDPNNPKRWVLGIDIDIREHNRQAIEAHPMSSRIRMLQGSSIEPNIVQQVTDFATEFGTVMVILDSNHTHDHVLAELEAYGRLVTQSSYCVVFDTVIDDTPDEYNVDRPWSNTNNPKTAVHEFLKLNDDFALDNSIDNKLLITVAPDGFLKRIT